MKLEADHCRYSANLCIANEQHVDAFIQCSESLDQKAIAEAKTILPPTDPHCLSLALNYSALCLAQRKWAKCATVARKAIERFCAIYAPEPAVPEIDGKEEQHAWVMFLMLKDNYELAEQRLVRALSEDEKVAKTRALAKSLTFVDGVVVKTLSTR